MAGFEGAPISSEENEKNPKELFMEAVEAELSATDISEEDAEEKRKAAGLIEGGFSDDPERDAKLFVGAGRDSEKEVIKTLDQKSE